MKSDSLLALDGWRNVDLPDGPERAEDRAKRARGVGVCGDGAKGTKGHALWAELGEGGGGSGGGVGRGRG